MGCMMRRGLRGQVGAGGGSGGDVPSYTSLAEARAALAAGADGDYVDVVGATSGKWFTTLHRVSPGVYYAPACDFRNAELVGTPTFTIGTAGTEDVVLSAASSSVVDATEGLIVDPTAGTVAVLFTFMGAFSGAAIQAYVAIRPQLTTAPDNLSHVGGGACRGDNYVGAIGALRWSVSVWRASGGSGDVRAPTFTGTIAVSGLIPFRGQGALWGRETNNQHSAIGAPVAPGEGINTSFISGAYATNWEASPTDWYACAVVEQQTSDLRPGITTVQVSGELS